MAQWLQLLVVLREDLGLVSSTHVVVIHNSSSRDLTPSSYLHEYSVHDLQAHIWYMYIHVVKTLI